MKLTTKLIFWFIVLILLFTANSQLPITDSVESNYALTAKEMLTGGDWLSPQIYGNYWFDKPIMFYWLTALAYKIFGINEFASRFFPALFGAANIALAIFAGKKLFSARTGFISGLILAGSLEFFIISKSIITDSVLFFFFNAALLCFYLGYSGSKKYYYGMYAFAALATLTKGPIGFLLPGLIIFLFLIFEKNFAELKHTKLFSGTLLFLLIAAPWYIAMYMVHGAKFINVFFGTHNFLRATVSEHPRDNVFYYYTLVTILSFFPWSAFIPQVIKNIFTAQQKIVKPTGKTLFLLLWAGTIFIFFQCMATKYITYTYPMLFPLTLLLASYLTYTPNIKLGNILVFNFAIYLCLVAAALFVKYKYILDIVSPWQLLLVATLSFIALLYNYIKDNQQTIITLIACSAVLFNLVMIDNVFKPLTEMRSHKALATNLQKLYPNESTVYIYGNYPTSAVFYSGKKLVKLMPQAEIANFVPKAYSWSSKNIMPYAAIEQIDNSKACIVVVKKSDYNKLSSANTLLTRNLQPLGPNIPWYVLAQ